jgi:N-acetyltransferase
MMDPPMQPVLADALVQLRPMVANDWDALFAVAADKQIWALHPAHDRWQEPVFRAYFEEGLAGLGALVIIDRATAAIIGASRYDRYLAEDGEVEIGWTFLARSHWGGVFNRSIKRLMLAYALARFDTAIFLVGEGNVISRRALEKIGAVLSNRRETVMRGGQPIAHVVYKITRDDFACGPLATPN